MLGKKMPPPALNALFAEVEVYERLKQTLLERLEDFRQALELRPVESVDVYEKCILECISEFFNKRKILEKNIRNLKIWGIRNLKKSNKKVTG